MDVDTKPDQITGPRSPSGQEELLDQNAKDDSIQQKEGEVGKFLELTYYNWKKLSEEASFLPLRLAVWVQFWGLRS